MMAASPRMRNALTLFSSVDDVLCHRVHQLCLTTGVAGRRAPVVPGVGYSFTSTLVATFRPSFSS